MNELVEKRLKDYKGCQVWKVIDNEEVTYMANDHDDNNLNCFKSLKDLKKWVDMMNN